MEQADVKPAANLSGGSMTTGVSKRKTWQIKNEPSAPTEARPVTKRKKMNPLAQSAKPGSMTERQERKRVDRSSTPKHSFN